MPFARAVLREVVKIAVNSEASESSGWTAFSCARSVLAIRRSQKALSSASSATIASFAMNRGLVLRPRGGSIVSRHRCGRIDELLTDSTASHRCGQSIAELDHRYSKLLGTFTKVGCFGHAFAGAGIVPGVFYEFRTERRGRGGFSDTATGVSGNFFNRSLYVGFAI